MVSPQTKQAAPARPWTAKRRSAARGTSTSPPTCSARLPRASVSTPTRAPWRLAISSASSRSGRANGDSLARWSTSSLQALPTPAIAQLDGEHRDLAARRLRAEDQPAAERQVHDQQELAQLQPDVLGPAAGT